MSAPVFCAACSAGVRHRHCPNAVRAAAGRLARAGALRLVAFASGDVSTHVQKFGRWPRRTLCGREVGWHRRVDPTKPHRLCARCAQVLAHLPDAKRLTAGDGHPSPAAAPLSPPPAPERHHAPSSVTTSRRSA